MLAEGRDRYGRTVARADCDGTYANAAQIQAGMAWVFDRYVTDRTLHAAKAEASEAQRELWGDEAPISPWQWRRGVR